MTLKNYQGLLKCNNALIHGSLFSLFSFINRGIGFLLLMILANILVPSDYGYLSLFTTIVSLLCYIIGMSAEGYLGISYFKEGKDGVTNTISGVATISIVVFVVLNFALFLFEKEMESLLSLPSSCIYISLLISFFTLYVNILLDYARLKERIGTYGVLSCSNALVNFLLSILFIKCFLGGWQGRIYAQAICCVVYGLIGMGYFFKNRYLQKPDLNYIKKMLIWGVPLIPHLTTSFIRQGCDRYIINYFYSIEDVGLFSFGLNIASIITMVGIGFNQSNSVEIYKTLSDNSITVIQKTEILHKQRVLYWKIYFVSWLLIVAGGFIFFPFFFPKYIAALPFFLLLSFYGFFFCIYLIYTNYLFYFNKTKLIMYVTFCSSILHLLLSLILTRYSLYITAVIYIFTQSLVSVLIVYFAKRNLNNNL